MANPREFTVRIAPQATLDLPLRLAAASWKDIRVHPGSDVSPEWEDIEDPRITSDNFNSIPLRGIITNELTLTMSLNAEEAIYFFGQAAQQSANTVVVGGNVFEEEFVVGVGATSWSPYMMIEVDHGIGFPVVYYNAQVRQIQVTGEGNAVITMTVTLDCGAHHQWADATLVNNDTNNAQIIGLASDAMWDETDATERRIYYKFTDVTAWAAGSGTVDLAIKVGAAASYGAQETTGVSANTFTQVLDSNVAISDTIHNKVGDPAEEVKIYIPSTATPTLDDEGYFQLGPPVWPPSFTTAPSLGSPNAELLYAGANQSIDTFDLTWDVPSVTRHGPGRKQLVNILKQGAHGGTLSVGRIMNDDLFMRQRRAQNLVEFRMDARSEGTFSDDYAHLVTIVAHARFKGTDPQTAADEYEDNLEGGLYPDTSHAWADGPVNAQVISSISAPAT